MKQWLVLLAVLVMTAGLSLAANMDCPANPALPQTVDTSATTSSYSISCLGITFDNFQVVKASGNWGSTVASVDLVKATNDGSTVFLDFNPNMSNATATAMDLWFFFRLTGPVTMLDLSVGGDPQNPSHILEKACNAPFDSNGLCTGSVVASVDAFTATDGTLALSKSFSGSPVYIFKDIAVPANSGLSFFEQSFHTAIPEPISMTLMGSGLLALGFLRRRSRKA